ncbi:MAG: DUF4010 domain-containing protein [Gammaproteobacteria bacterium]|nr:DUF4010 domain-containing protein [Gammaproteobacteria bacterium]
MLHILLSFVISMLMGLLIGIEREHSHAEGVQPIGVRTFILFSLMGTVAAFINQNQLTLVISCFVFAIIIIGYLRSTSVKVKKIDIGITTEVSAGIVYCLGYLTFFENILSVIISAFVLLVLIERQRLHRIARQKFAAHEIETVIILIIFSLGVIPILPDHPIDTWSLFNPRNVGILIMTIAIIQFGGYVAIKLLGEKIGLAVTGFLGGFVSSTLIFFNLSHTLKAHPKSALTVIASGILAVLAMLIEVMAIILVASPVFFLYILKPIIVMCAICVVFICLLLRYEKNKGHKLNSSMQSLNLLSLFKSAILIAITLILIALARRFIDTDALLIIAFLTGLFEIHGISLATALLYLNQHLAINTASAILFTALCAAFVSKIVLLWVLTPRRFAFQTTCCLLTIVAGGGVTYWLTM